MADLVIQVQMPQGEGSAGFIVVVVTREQQQSVVMTAYSLRFWGYAFNLLFKH